MEPVLIDELDLYGKDYDIFASLPDVELRNEITDYDYIPYVEVRFFPPWKVVYKRRIDDFICEYILVHEETGVVFKYRVNYGYKIPMLLHVASLR